jgi:hypothetical protein
MMKKRLAGADDPATVQPQVTGKKTGAAGGLDLEPSNRDQQSGRRRRGRKPKPAPPAAQYQTRVRTPRDPKGDYETR